MTHEIIETISMVTTDNYSIICCLLIRNECMRISCNLYKNDTIEDHFVAKNDVTKKWNHLKSMPHEVIT
jgi:hypothetical protein